MPVGSDGCDGAVGVGVLAVNQGTLRLVNLYVLGLGLRFGLRLGLGFGLGFGLGLVAVVLLSDVTHVTFQKEQYRLSDLVDSKNALTRR